MKPPPKKLKPIKTDREHKEALIEIRKLWKSEPDTPSSDCSHD